MSEPTIRYDGTRFFDTASGSLFAYVSDFAAVMGPIAAFDEIELDDLVRAMGEARDAPSRDAEADSCWLLSEQDQPWNEVEPTADGNYTFRLGDGASLH